MPIIYKLRYSLGVLYLQVLTQSPPMPNDNVKLSELQCWKKQLDEITTNPLLSLMLQCLGIMLARPSADQVCVKIATAKESPQSVIMSNTLYHIKVTACIYYQVMFDLTIITMVVVCYH